MWRTFNGLRRGAFRLIFETLSQKTGAAAPVSVGRNKD
ncbi:hypothetical protein BSU04_44685 [Caballeronia sordidicola]|uniref:Uncharacterized protein n=1 Tax=Caballeronia sordidicola TaxID=196367 RepID=A0A226WLA5_CABSO|nr:hypothetical protein BSU04_44685 [Caballeronia sordidicola]